MGAEFIINDIINDYKKLNFFSFKKMAIRVSCVYSGSDCHNKGVYDGYCWIHRSAYSVKSFNICEISGCNDIPEYGYFAGINNLCKKHWLIYESSSTEYKRYSIDPNICIAYSCKKLCNKSGPYNLRPRFCLEHEKIIEKIMKAESAKKKQYRS